MSRVSAAALDRSKGRISSLAEVMLPVEFGLERLLGRVAPLLGPPVMVNQVLLETGTNSRGLESINRDAYPGLDETQLIWSKVL